MTFSHRPRKQFGQNFLTDPSVIAKILTAADLREGDRVFEIGPGKGALTDRLLASGAAVTVCEVDRDLAEYWRQRHDPRLTVVEADVLGCDWEKLLPAAPCTLVANLPYNISTPILFTVLAHRQRFRRLVLMFQREVAERLRAAPGTRTYGSLSILFQCWYRIERVAQVRPGAFFPPPKVHSEVLCFDPLPVPLVSPETWPAFHKLVRGAFQQRRKTLRNSLLGAGYAAATLDAAFALAGLDGRRRAETLSADEFLALARALDVRCSHHEGAAPTS